MALIEHLPAGSALWQELGYDGAWTPETHLLAQAVDLLAGANYQRGGGKGEKPKPLPRPSDLKKKEDQRNRALEKAALFKEKLNRRNDAK